MALCCAVWTIVVIALILYIFFDVNFFVRLAFTIGFAKYFQKKVNILDGATTYNICLTQDVDVFLRNMNDARFIREMDLARFSYYFRCGLYEELILKKKGGNVTLGASNVRYRRAIPIFTLYKVETKVIYWDEKALYLEQRFVSLNDGFVRAVALLKQNVIGMNAEELMKVLTGENAKKPELSEDLDLWLKSIEASSAKLRPKSD